MNQKKFLQVFEGLVSNGIDVEKAMLTAERLSGKSDPVVSSKDYTKGKLTATGTVKERLIAFGEKHNGHEWGLQQLARAIGVDVNSCSAAITKLLGPNLRRTGLGRYVYYKTAR